MDTQKYNDYKSKKGTNGGGGEAWAGFQGYQNFDNGDFASTAYQDDLYADNPDINADVREAYQNEQAKERLEQNPRMRSPFMTGTAMSRQDEITNAWMVEMSRRKPTEVKFIPY